MGFIKSASPAPAVSPLLHLPLLPLPLLQLLCLSGKQLSYRPKESSKAAGTGSGRAGGGAA